MADYLTYLILAIFVASGISFFEGRVARFIVRITTIVAGIVGLFASLFRIALKIAFAPDFLSPFSGADGLHMLGDAILLLYFCACVLTCIPLSPARRMLQVGLVLHFVILPFATFLDTFSAFVLPFDIRLAIFSHNLSPALIYAMLWFRMLERQVPARTPGAPANEITTKIVFCCLTYPSVISLSS